MLYICNIQNRIWSLLMVSLQNYIELTTGVHPSRIENTSVSSTSTQYSLYTQHDFMWDDYQLDDKNDEKIKTINSNIKPTLTKKDDLLISLLSCRMIKVRSKSINKVITANYLSVKINSNALDLSYLFWLFNSSMSIKKQLHPLFQSSRIFYRLTIRDIYSLNIDLPPIKQQQNIGMLWQTFQRKQWLEQKQRILRTKLLQHQLDNLYA